RLSTWQTALLVAAGGGVGAALRLIVTLSMPAVTTPTLVEVPWATLWVNLIGCLGLGALVGALEIRPGRPWMRPLLGTGLCGGFTTMSSVVLEGSAMIGAEFPIPALGYAVATVGLCLGAVLTGFVLGRRLARRREGSGGRRAVARNGRGRPAPSRPAAALRPAAPTAPSTPPRPSKPPGATASTASPRVTSPLRVTSTSRVPRISRPLTAPTTDPIPSR